MYTVSAIPLTSVTSLPILGVTFTPNLTFSLHVANAVAKARRLLGFVTRVSKACGPTTFRVLYTALVLPHLEYCSAVWCPHQTNLVDSLESVQRRATRTYFTRQHNPALPYDSRLKNLKWHTLAHRRRVARVGLTCRLLDGSLKGTYLATIPRINKRSGQPELIRARTKHHSSSPILAGIEDFISAPLRIRSPLPQDRTESVSMCRLFSKHLQQQAS